MSKYSYKQRYEERKRKKKNKEMIKPSSTGLYHGFFRGILNSEYPF